MCMYMSEYTEENLHARTWYSTLSTKNKNVHHSTSGFAKQQMFTAFPLRDDVISMHIPLVFRFLLPGYTNRSSLTANSQDRTISDRLAGELSLWVQKRE